jgi:hypothetical protein
MSGSRRRQVVTAPWGDGACHQFVVTTACMWAERIGRHLHATIGVDCWALHPDGSFVTLPVGPPARNAVYVAVDTDDDVLYVGRVHRSTVTALTDRLDHHHAVPSHAVGLWVLPFGDDCPLLYVDRFEREMIKVYQPPSSIAQRRSSAPWWWDHDRPCVSGGARRDPPLRQPSLAEQPDDGGHGAR